ncbi:MAG: mercuric reductase [Alkalispirochaeta sp.]
MKHYDVIIVGTGQATGTILPDLLKENLSVATVEADRVGGTCVNWGCTPTKTLVASARAAHIVNRGAEFGIEISEKRVNFSRVMERVNGIRHSATSGFQSWLEKETDFYHGTGRFIDENTVAIGETRITGDTIIVHTGARARKPDVPGVDVVPWLDNRGLLDLQELPRHLLIVGGSYIGMEFGQAFRRLGSEVTILEKGDRIIFREDPEFSTTAQKVLEKEGVAFNLNSGITGVEHGPDGITVSYKQEGETKKTSGSHILFAVGRLANSDDLNLEAAGVKTDERGFIGVDDHCRTSQPHIYAVGDVNGKGAFTHTSVHDGQVFLSHYFQRKERRISDRIPTYAMYIDPPLARVGITATEAERQGLDYLTGRMEMSAVSRAREKAETEGLMKVVVEKTTGKILGAAVFGVGGDEIIGMIALAMQAGLPYSKLQETVIPHPTVAELVPWIFNNLK